MSEQNIKIKPLILPVIISYPSPYGPPPEDTIYLLPPGEGRGNTRTIIEEINNQWIILPPQQLDDVPKDKIPTI